MTAGTYLGTRDAKCERVRFLSERTQRPVPRGLSQMADAKLAELIERLEQFYAAAKRQTDESVFACHSAVRGNIVGW